MEDKLHRLPLGYVDARPRGELLSRVTNDIDNVSQSLQQTMSQLLTSLLTVVGVLVMMVVISPLLAVIALLTVPLSTWLTRAIARRSQGQFVAQWRYTGELNGQIEEAFTGHELVTVFGRRGEVEETFAAKNAQLRDASYRAQFVSGIIMPSMMFLGNLNYVAVAVIGGLRVAVGRDDAWARCRRSSSTPGSSPSRSPRWRRWPTCCSPGWRRPSGCSSCSTRPSRCRTRRVPAVRAQRRGRVAFEHVSFRYRPDVPLIDDLSLVAEPGQTVAIVGPTGAGKTTLVNLVMRFYELDGGRITLDGVDIATMARADLRSGIGMVLQDTWLFGGTIRENIAYGNPEATEEQLLAAARATYVDRFVRSLPDGYDTRVDSDGGAVSAGEKQLITIARAFLADPSLLILDEATSSVDTRTEVLVQRAMARLRSDRTSFVIAHRLSTIRDADLILVMDARPDRRAGHARRAAGRAAAPTTRCTRPSSPRRRCSGRRTGASTCRGRVASARGLRAARPRRCWSATAAGSTGACAPPTGAPRSTCCRSPDRRATTPTSPSPTVPRPASSSTASTIGRRLLEVTDVDPPADRPRGIGARVRAR